MLKYVVLLIVLCGIHYSNSARQNEKQSSEIARSGIKKNEFGANGFQINSNEIIENLRNPVLEYLFRINSLELIESSKNEITRGSQTLLLPKIQGDFHSFPGLTIFSRSSSKRVKTLEKSEKNAENFFSFGNFLINPMKKSNSAEFGKTHETNVTSPVLYVSKNTKKEKEGFTRVETNPATAILINTYNSDGIFKNSVTHFPSDFDLAKDLVDRNEALDVGGARNTEKYFNNFENHHYNFADGVKFWQQYNIRQQTNQGKLPRPVGNYLTSTAIRDPSYPNLLHPASLNSAVIEYGAGAKDLEKFTPSKRSKKDLSTQGAEVESKKPKVVNVDLKGKKIQSALKRFQKEIRKDKKEDSLFYKVTMLSDDFKKINRNLGYARREPKENKKKFEPAKENSRKKRETTSVILKTKGGDIIDISLEEPVRTNGEVFDFRQEKVRSFNTVVVNTPPLSSILKPPNHGYVDKKKKPKPVKPNKEEASSEEVDEDHEEESGSQTHNNESESVAISPPPDGASVAEAKPIGLAIAGPGGVAASKPQGTAVVGPGGLAIARPVGTAIAGVPVEGTVPIGGANKNKKKPKQEPEQPDSELHYVGGLTGPIGNPQPNEFIKGVNFRFFKTADGKNPEEESFVRESPTGKGLQFKLGLKDNKYGIISVSSSSDNEETNFRKTVESPAYFHGVFGSDAENLDLLHNYHLQYQ